MNGAAIFFGIGFIIIFFIIIYFLGKTPSPNRIKDYRQYNENNKKWEEGELEECHFSKLITPIIKNKRYYVKTKPKGIFKQKQREIEFDARDLTILRNDRTGVTEIVLGLNHVINKELYNEIKKVSEENIKQKNKIVELEANLSEKEFDKKGDWDSVMDKQRDIKGLFPVFDKDRKR